MQKLAIWELISYQPDEKGKPNTLLVIHYTAVMLLYPWRLILLLHIINSRSSPTLILHQNALMRSWLLYTCCISLFGVNENCTFEFWDVKEDWTKNQFVQAVGTCMLETILIKRRLNLVPTQVFFRLV